MDGRDEILERIRIGFDAEVLERRIFIDMHLVGPVGEQRLGSLGGV